MNDWPILGAVESASKVVNWVKTALMSGDGRRRFGSKSPPFQSRRCSVRCAKGIARPIVDVDPVREVAFRAPEKA